MGPVLAAVGRRGPADVGGAARDDSSGLERRYECGPVRQHMRLNLGRMLAGAHGERIMADPGQGDLRGNQRGSGESEQRQKSWGVCSAQNMGEQSGHSESSLRVQISSYAGT